MLGSGIEDAHHSMYLSSTCRVLLLCLQSANESNTSRDHRRPGLAVLWATRFVPHVQPPNTMSGEVDAVYIYDENQYVVLPCSAMLTSP